MSDRPKKKKLDYTVEEIKVPKGHQHPAPTYDALPRHEFSMLIVAPKGSGKTTLICNILMKFYLHYFHEIWVFSPTIGSDEKWDIVKKKKGILVEYKPPKESKKRKKGVNDDDDDDDDDDAGAGTNFDHLLASMKPNPFINFGANGRLNSGPKKFDGRIPKDHFCTQYDEETLREIMSTQMADIKRCSKNGGSKHAAKRVLFVFDDMVGSSLFSGMRANPFKTLNANLRHHSASLLMITQSYKEIPKVARVNTSAVAMFAVANEKEIEQIYEENPCGLKKKEWLVVYAHATDAPFGFLFINYQKLRDERMMKNFESYLKLSPKEVEPDTTTGKGKKRKASDQP